MPLIKICMRQVNAMSLMSLGSCVIKVLSDVMASFEPQYCL